MIYHVPGCMHYDRVAERNRVYFKTEQAAVAAGFRRARNCPGDR
jgi:deoxyribonuclease-1